MVVCVLLKYTALGPRYTRAYQWMLVKSTVRPATTLTAPKLRQLLNEIRLDRYNPNSCPRFGPHRVPAASTVVQPTGTNQAHHLLTHPHSPTSSLHNQLTWDLSPVAMAIELPRVNLDEPRYDQSTYLNRAKHFLIVTNPLNVFATEEQLDRAARIVRDYR